MTGRSSARRSTSNVRVFKVGLPFLTFSVVVKFVILEIHNWLLRVLRKPFHLLNFASPVKEEVEVIPLLLYGRSS
jgi:hypothetical protein